MNANTELRKRALTAALMIAGLVACQTHAFAQEIRFMPIRMAPLGSPVGTIGEPVSPLFNNTLNCWELTLAEAGVEVDIDVQGGGWGNWIPNLGIIQAAVLPGGYENGIGAPLNPKGWPGSPEDGIYQAHLACSDSGDPCVPPFDATCGGGASGSCLHNPDWIMPPCANDFRGVATQALRYAWGTAVREECNVDPDPRRRFTFGGWILEIPEDAAGTYVIAVDPDPNNTFMFCCETPVPNVVMTSACITITPGACCIDTDSDELRDTCQDDKFGFECVADGGLYLGGGSTCSGLIGACCLDGDGDGLNDTCVVMDRDCCIAGEGRFSGSGFGCLGDQDNSGVDDLCDGVIPAVSEWGLIVMTLLLLVGIKVCFARRRGIETSCHT